MGVSLALISKYEDQNKEATAESRGTKYMITKWRDKCVAKDQIGAFCKVLRNAGLCELAGELSGGMLPLNSVLFERHVLLN